MTRPNLLIPTHLVPERAGTVAFLSSQERQGDWLLPRLFRAVSVFGSVVIDLTRARVGAGTSQIEVRAFMANLEILVPPDLRVECDVEAILGNVETNTKTQQVPSADAPLIVIKGTAFMGNVEVKLVDPDAPGWFEKLTARLSG